MVKICNYGFDEEFVEKHRNIYGIAYTQNILSGRYKNLIIWYLKENDRRYNQIKKFLTSISQGSLTKQLRELENIAEDIDILILSIPIDVMPKVRHIISNMPENIIIVDTSNYYPFRNNKIEAIENGIPESVWVSQQLGKSVIKAFNNQLAYTLANKGAPRDSENRIAMAVAGNDIKEKEIIMNIVSEVGFDTIDNGELKDSWRQQPGTPAYCTELNKEDLKVALENANKNEAPYRRDKVIENISPEFTSEDIVKLNRKIYNV